MQRGVSAQSLLEAYGYVLEEDSVMADTLVYQKTMEKCTIQREFGQDPKFSILLVKNSEHQTVCYLELYENSLRGKVLLKDPSGRMLLLASFSKGNRRVFSEFYGCRLHRVITYNNEVPTSVILRHSPQSNLMVELSVSGALLNAGEYDPFNQKWEGSCYCYEQGRIARITSSDNRDVAREFKDGVMTERKGDVIVYQGGFLDSLPFKYCRDGYGVLYEDGQVVYKGSFKRNTFNGAGQLYRNGQLCFDGVFYNGRPTPLELELDDDEMGPNPAMINAMGNLPLTNAEYTALLNRVSPLLPTPPGSCPYLPQPEEWWMTASVQAQLNQFAGFFPSNITLPESDVPNMASMASMISMASVPSMAGPAGGDASQSLPASVCRSHITRPPISPTHATAQPVMKSTQSAVQSLHSLRRTMAPSFPRLQPPLPTLCSIPRKSFPVEVTSGCTSMDLRSSHSSFAYINGLTASMGGESLSPSAESDNSPEFVFSEAATTISSFEEYAQFNSEMEGVEKVTLTGCNSDGILSFKPHIQSLVELRITAGSLAKLKAFCLSDLPNLAIVLVDKDCCHASSPSPDSCFTLINLPSLETCQIGANCFASFAAVSISSWAS